MGETMSNRGHSWQTLGESTARCRAHFDGHDDNWASIFGLGNIPPAEFMARKRLEMRVEELQKSTCGLSERSKESRGSGQ
jgi:hypothetical protein